jgi:peptidoglycan/LPS O-acetylase OafA/YrhL
MIEKSTETKKTPAKLWIPELDGLRALAAFAVMLAHFRPPSFLRYDSSIYTPLCLLNTLSIPNLSVVFFFTLSSFLLTYLGVNEYKENGFINLKRFYLRRIFRIWPLYYTILIIVLGFTYFEKLVGLQYSSANTDLPWVLDHLWMFTFYASNWSFALNGMWGFIDHSNPMLGILWSIAVEEQFYVIFPILLSFLLKQKRGTQIRFLFVMYFASIIFRSVFLFIPAQVTGAVQSMGMYYATTTYINVFMAGGIAGYLVASGNIRSNFLKKRLAGILIIVLLISLSFLWIGNIWYPYTITSLIIYEISGIILASVIIWVVSNKQSKFAIFLRSKTMRVLGLLTYGIYMWHPIIQRIIYYNFEKFTITSTNEAFVSIAIFIIYLIATICVATITYALIEHTFLSLKSKVSSISANISISKKPPLPWKIMVSLGLLFIIFLDIFVNLGYSSGSYTRTFKFLENRILQISIPSISKISPTSEPLIFTPHTRFLIYSSTNDLKVSSVSRGDYVLLSDTDQFLKLEQTGWNGYWSTVDVHEGESLIFNNVGNWNKNTNSFLGLPATFYRNRWVIDTKSMIPANPNPQLKKGSDNNSIPEWWISPGEAEYQVTFFTNEIKPYVRIKALKDSNYLSLSGQFPLNSLDGEPIALQAIVRSNKAQVMTIYDMIDSFQNNTIMKVNENINQWNDISLSGVITSFPSTNDNFSIGIQNVRKGDWFELREFNAFIGNYPTHSQ